MSQDIVQGASHKAPASSFDALAPLSSRALFWRAGYVAASPFLEHIPLLFWIVENARPGMVVSLGVADAVPYFAACQAIDKLNLEAVCFAVEPESDADLAPVMAHNAQNFPDFSEISIGDRRDMAQTLQGSEIDLLIVNEPLSQALADEIDRDWLPLLSDRALVLFAKGGDAAVLSRYADRIALKGGVFPVDTSLGVCLALRGDQHDERLMRLARLKPGKTGYMSVRNVFSRIGELHRTSFEMRCASGDLGDTRKQRDKAVKDLEARDKQLAEERARLTKVTDQLKATTDQVATMRSEVFDGQAALDALKSELAESATSAEELRGAVARLERERDQAQASTEKRYEELAQLVTRQEAQAGEMEELRQARDALKAETEAWQTEIRTLRQTLTQMEETQERKDAAASDLREAHDAMKTSCETLRADTDKRFEELATMTRMVEERDRRIAEQTQAFSALKQSADDNRQALDTASGELAEAQEVIRRERLHHRTIMQLTAAKEEILLAMHGRRVSGRYRAMRAELEAQVARVEKSDLFDASWYRETYPDIAASSLSAAEHFVRAGAYEGRNPGPKFDSIKYHMANPEVAAQKLPALVHYLRHGQAEGREVFAVDA